MSNVSTIRAREVTWRRAGLAALFSAICVLMAQAHGTDMPSARVNIMSWPRMNAASFRCYMERTIGYRDKRFNCSLTHYRNAGDPCKNTDAYYEGPVFPNAFATKIHPLASDVVLSWEHGELQDVSITLDGTFSDQAVRKAFTLPPAQGNAYPTFNVMRVDIDHSHPGKTVLSLTGFDHQGAGDVDCGG
jgi:hypothetical protein